VYSFPDFQFIVPSLPLQNIPDTLLLLRLETPESILTDLSSDSANSVITNASLNTVGFSPNETLTNDSWSTVRVPLALAFLEKQRYNSQKNLIVLKAFLLFNLAL